MWTSPPGLFHLNLSSPRKTLTLESPQTSSVKMWDLCDLQAAGHVWGRKTERKDAQPEEPRSLQLSKGLTNGRQDKNTSFFNSPADAPLWTAFSHRPHSKRQTSTLKTNELGSHGTIIWWKMCLKLNIPKQNLPIQSLKPSQLNLWLSSLALSSSSFSLFRLRINKLIKPLIKAASATASK